MPRIGSIDQFSSHSWPIHEGYRIEHGSLIPVAGVVRTYDAFPRLSLAGDFGKLQEGNEQGMLVFAHAWGLLGYQAVADPTSDAEPLSWIWGQARNVRLVLELSYYLQAKDLDGLGRYLSAQSSAPDPQRKDEHVVLVMGLRMENDQVRVSASDPAGAARAIIAKVVNAGLAELRYLVEGDHLVPTVHQSCPLVTVYWHLAHVVGLEGKLARCQECERLFLVTDKRQRFCPPPPPWIGAGESLCGARARKRKYREKGGSIRRVGRQGDRS